MNNLHYTDKIDWDKWDDLYYSSSQSCIFFSTEWIKASEGKIKNYAICRGGIYIAGLVIEINSDRQAIQTGITSYLGPIFRDLNNTPSITDSIDAGEELAKICKGEFRNVDFRCSPWLQDVRSFIWSGFESSVRYTYVINKTEVTDVWAKFDSSLKRNIRKAQTFGAFIEESTSVSILSDFVLKTFMNQGTIPWFEPSSSFTFIDTLITAGCVKIFLIKNKQNEIGGVILIALNKNKAHYVLGGRNRDLIFPGAISFGLWSIIKFLFEELSVNVFDFEGSMLKGVERYFRQFGGILKPYYKLRIN